MKKIILTTYQAIIIYDEIKKRLQVEKDVLNTFIETKYDEEVTKNQKKIVKNLNEIINKLESNERR